MLFAFCVFIFLKEANFESWKYRTPRYWPIGFWARRKEQKWKRRLSEWRPAAINHWYVGIQFAWAQMAKAQHTRGQSNAKLAKLKEWKAKGKRQLCAAQMNIIELREEERIHKEEKGISESERRRRARLAWALKFIFSLNSRLRQSVIKRHSASELEKGREAEKTIRRRVQAVFKWVLIKCKDCSECTMRPKNRASTNSKISVTRSFVVHGIAREWTSTRQQLQTPTDWLQFVCRRHLRFKFHVNQERNAN